MSDWITRMPPEHTRIYGVEELHNVWFLPNNWPGQWPTISLLIPECELQCATPGPDGVPIAMINRPKTNKSIKHWVRFTCQMATREKAGLCFSCDTVKQTAHAAKMATRLLPNHRRVALERMYNPANRIREKLS